ncbi:helix-turn-helix domain-containing protein [Yersinia ruckeri]|uniref:helix-turn-helix domain-containing protein n=1 Tax=Gammaproteobacteria TaxID=1236 RepID=UPI0008FE1325|nr:helix-turn-helix transcriptional regulator [Yersinia ruckeri]EJP3285070.1 helix-turn-helix transcriptional regulator [Vibrio parahaemolyticus]MCR9610864.1 helix-turn-helix domain-containing protein [Vibrio alginolyticus]MCK8585803.1 helix-turn-helix domain-containing protein [Yersinia ruckeri]MCR9615612.1 helix-turn-helix domain-containing protein [Vibrio alginolyticus]OJB81268.1 transcriptional regulator [Yersinia ruckeri]
MKKNEYQICFGLAVRKQRNNRNLTQEELASLCDLDRTYIGSVERGERNVSLVNIHKIASALNIEVKELFE